MERLKIAKEILKMAADLLFADSDYIYDPDHRKHPGGGYHKTEKGWSKLDEREEKKDSGNKPSENVVKRNPTMHDVYKGMSNDKLISLANKSEYHGQKETLHSVGDYIMNGNDDFLQQDFSAVINNRNPNSVDFDKLKEWYSKAKKGMTKSVFKQSILRHRDCPEKVLRKEIDTSFRGSVLENPSCPTDILDNFTNRIVNGENFYKTSKGNLGGMHTYHGIYNNPNLSRENAKKLVDYALTPEGQDRVGTTSLSGMMGKNKNFSPDDLDTFADIDISEVKMGVARNKNTSAKTLDKLSNSDDSFVLDSVAYHKNTLPETLDRIGDKTKIEDEDYDAYRFVKFSLAENPNTPTKTLRKMTTSVDKDVASKAKEALSKRQEIKFDITKLSPELREKVKDWDAEDIAKFIGWLKEHNG